MFLAFLTRIFGIPHLRDHRPISRITTQVEPVPMAPRKWINDFLALSSANIRTDLQQSPFYGKALEDANAHIQHLMEIYITFTI
jgi:hypothetical protein